MTLDRFTELLAAELRLRGEPFDRRALAGYVEAAWPWMMWDEDVHRWSREFLAIRQAAWSSAGPESL
jgi:hypothetical protein